MNSKTTLPYWRNSQKDPVIRDLSRNTAAIEINNDELRVKVPRSPRKFLIVFACFFVPLFALFVVYFIPDPTRWFVLIGSIIAFSLAIGIIDRLSHFHESLGDFLVIHRDKKTIILPRSKRHFPLEQVLGFQWIRGRSKRSTRIEIDLNLLAKESGEIIRYHIMCYPSEELLKQIVSFSGVRLDRIDLGGRGNRDVDNSSDPGELTGQVDSM